MASPSSSHGLQTWYLSPFGVNRTWFPPNSLIRHTLFKVTWHLLGATGYWCPGFPRRSNFIDSWQTKGRTRDENVANCCLLVHWKADITNHSDQPCSRMEVIRCLLVHPLSFCGLGGSTLPIQGWISPRSNECCRNLAGFRGQWLWMIRSEWFFFTITSW